MKVGYIGLGQMGKAIAVNVAKAGLDLMVYDLKEEPVKELVSLGAKAGHSPREVGEHAEVVELSVLNDAQVEQVILGKDGVLEGAKPGTVIAVHSTTVPATIRRIAEAAAKQGVDVLDAPVSGGAGGAAAHQLCYMVGGDAQVLERCRPVFSTSGPHIFHLGELGAGAITKLVQQIVLCLNRMSAYEGLGLAEKAGLDPLVVRDVLRVTSAQSRVVDNWAGLSSPDSDGAVMHDFWVPLQPILALAHEMGFSLPGTAVAQQVWPLSMNSRGPH